MALVEACQLFAVSVRSALKKLVLAAGLQHLSHSNKAGEAAD